MIRIGEFFIFGPVNLIDSLELFKDDIAKSINDNMTALQVLRIVESFIGYHGTDTLRIIKGVPFSRAITTSEEVTDKTKKLEAEIIDIRKDADNILALIMELQQKLYAVQKALKNDSAT